MSRHKLSIPDRWLEYKSVGKRIHITPFFAFKVPLRKTFFNNVSPEQKFSPSDLIESVPNLSLVIDLTNTEKYYSGDEFLNSGIEYKKIFCPGHQIPPKKLIREFFDMVDDFMEKTRNYNSEDKVRLIGVHCTHGINRTGFFICSYMINKLGYTSEKAISEFNSARGHNIERENYLNALKEYDTNPFQFQPSSSQYHNTNSGGCSYSDVSVEDRLVSRNSYRRQYSSQSNADCMYRPVQNYGKNAVQTPTDLHHQPYQRNFNFYDDHPVGEHLRCQTRYQHPFAVNEPVLESIDPYFRSFRRRTYRNSRQRKY